MVPAGDACPPLRRIVSEEDTPGMESPVVDLERRPPARPARGAGRGLQVIGSRSMAACASRKVDNSQSKNSPNQ